MNVKGNAVAGALTAALLVAPTTHAQTKAACLDATGKGQTLRDAHKLVEARDQFRVCAAASCPAVLQADCASFLAEVERLLPTVVPSAKSSAGDDLADVKVLVDGVLLRSKLSGEAVAIDPGAHLFHFEGSDGKTADRQVIIREVEKGQPVAVVLVGAASAGSERAGTVTESKLPLGASWWRPLGYVASGVGVTGVGVGAVLGVMAMTGKSAHCAADGACSPGTSAAIKTESTMATVGWIAGGALVAAGAALVLWAPSRSEGDTTISVTPSASITGAGAMIVGSF
jgi:hypothetical protein